MRKTLLAAIIAATALVPPAALAQERGRNRDQSQTTNGAERGNRGGGWRSEGGQRPQAQPQQQRSWGNRGDGGQGSWRQRQPAQAQPVQAQPAQARPAQARPAQPVQAQQPARVNRSQWNGGQQGQQAQQRQRGDRGQWNNGQQRQGQQQWGGNRDDRGGVNRNNNRGWNDRNRGNDNRGGWNNNRNNGSRWNNGWRSNNRYDWQGYRNGNRSVFRLPRYYAPSGWGYGYRRFSTGYTLNSILFGSQYWINDPFNYRLPDVYGPYRWVRYYNDALLVDIYTGEVVDTVYDIFW